MSLSQELTQFIAEHILSQDPESYSYMDKNKIVWKIVYGEKIGKRSVWTFDNRACWLQDTTPENVKSWWCGENADYNEIFKRN